FLLFDYRPQNDLAIQKNTHVDQHADPKDQKKASFSFAFLAGSAGRLQLNRFRQFLKLFLVDAVINHPLRPYGLTDRSLKLLFSDQVSRVPRVEFRLATLYQIGWQDQIAIQISAGDPHIQALLHFVEGAAVEIDPL